MKADAAKPLSQIGHLTDLMAIAAIDHDRELGGNLAAREHRHGQEHPAEGIAPPLRVVHLRVGARE